MDPFPQKKHLYTYLNNYGLYSLQTYLTVVCFKLITFRRIFIPRRFLIDRNCFLKLPTSFVTDPLFSGAPPILGNEWHFDCFQATFVSAVLTRWFSPLANNEVSHLLHSIHWLDNLAVTDQSQAQLEFVDIAILFRIQNKILFLLLRQDILFLVVVVGVVARLDSSNTICSHPRYVVSSSWRNKTIFGYY